MNNTEQHTTFSLPPFYTKTVESLSKPAASRLAVSVQYTQDIRLNFPNGGFKDDGTAHTLFWANIISNGPFFGWFASLGIQSWRRIKDLTAALPAQYPPT